MKPDWDKLMEEYKDHKSALVADVDCTTEGKSLCEEIGVQGFPTIKHGDPSGLEDYEGGRDFEALKKFADENLGPKCGPNNMDLCDAEKKAQIEGFQALSEEKLQEEIEGKEAEMKKADEELEELLKSLQSQYEAGQKKAEDTKKAVKESGLGQMKSVMVSKKKAKSEL